MNIRRGFFLATGCFFFLNSFAQESYTLTLAQAREYALQHNKTLLNARDQVVASKARYRETLAQGLPQIDGSLDYMTYFNYELNFSLGSGDFVPDTAGLEPGEKRVLGMLGSMFSSEPIIMGDQLSGKIQFSQLIFSGQFYAGLKTAKIAKKLADQSLVSTEMDVVENITNSYCLILTSEQSLVILSENIKNLESILQHTTNYFNAGIAEATDVDQLKMTVAQLKNSQKSFERMTQLNYNMLKFQLGVAPETQITLTDSLEFILGSSDPSQAMIPEYDVTENINYQLLESQVQITGKQLDIQNWAYSPMIVGFYSYTQKFVTSGFDLTPNHVAGVSMTLPIFSSGMRNARVSQAKVNLDIAERSQSMVKDQLELQKNQLNFNYQSALENYNIQKENVEIAGRVYKSIQNKYRQGIVSSLDLTQANSNYLNAQGNYNQSVLTLIQARTSLDKLYNRL